MLSTSPSLEMLISQFSKLPGIGKKTAQRLALHILKESKEEIALFSRALIDVKEKVKRCSTCSNITEHDPCAICESPKRDRTTICVVEEPNDVFAIEKTNEFKGVYHVLGGVLSPLDGIGPEDLQLHELLDRCKGDVHEIIFALNPDVEGEATTLYLAKLLKPLQIKLTRIARGIPIGSDLEFTDDATIIRALASRTDV